MAGSWQAILVFWVAASSRVIALERTTGGGPVAVEETLIVSVIESVKTSGAACTCRLRQEAVCLCNWALEAADCGNARVEGREGAVQLGEAIAKVWREAEIARRRAEEERC